MNAQDRLPEVNGQSIRIVRSLSRIQLVRLFDLYNEEWPSPSRTHDDLERAVAGADIVIGVVEVSTDELIGFCRVVSDRGFRAWILGLVVNRNFRDCGLGRLIMDEVMQSEKLSSIHSVGLTCAPEMIPFYEKWGFEIRENEVVMNRVLRS